MHEFQLARFLSQVSDIRIVCMLLLVLCGTDLLAAQSLYNFKRTETRAPCRDAEPLGKPLFGDLHVHTNYSFDAYTSSVRSDPWDAYRYAKGEKIKLPNDSFNAKIFHAGTKLNNNNIYSNGGRVLCATALGKDIQQAQTKAYKFLEKVDWQGAYYRTDIGFKAI